MNTTQLAYLAGLFDGEGSIVIERSKISDFHTGDGYRYQLKAIIRIRESWILQEFQSEFGGSLRNVSFSNPKHAPVGSWRLTDKGAAILLSEILPFLRLKREQALLAFEFRTIKQSFQRGRGKSRSIEQIDGQRLCYQKMRELNTRGVSRLESNATCC